MRIAAPLLKLISNNVCVPLPFGSKVRLIMIHLRKVPETVSGKAKEKTVHRKRLQRLNRGSPPPSTSGVSSPTRFFQIKQALVTKPNDAFFLHIEAKSLYEVSRYQDAIAASNAAIRAADGKYGFMHWGFLFQIEGLERSEGHP